MTRQLPPTPRPEQWAVNMLVTLNNSLDEVFEVVNKYSKESEMMEEDFDFIPTTVIEQQSRPDQKKVGFLLTS